MLCNSLELTGQLLPGERAYGDHQRQRLISGHIWHDKAWCLVLSMGAFSSFSYQLILKKNETSDSCMRQCNICPQNSLINYVSSKEYSVPPCGFARISSVYKLKLRTGLIRDFTKTPFFILTGNGTHCIRLRKPSKCQASYKHIHQISYKTFYWNIISTVGTYSDRNLVVSENQSCINAGKFVRRCHCIYLCLGFYLMP